ncbi:MAG: hypothetical protein ABI863_09980 [Ginsengibacter sp.]
MDYAFLYSGLKDFDQAFYHLNKGYEQRIGIVCLSMIFCIRYPMLNELKSDPRFNELTRKMWMDNRNMLMNETKSCPSNTLPIISFSKTKVVLF